MLGNLRRQSGAAALGGTALALLVAGGSPGWLAAREPATPAVPLVASGETIVGERIVYPTGAPAKVTAAVVLLAPGEETGWHTHGMPVLGYVLEGELEVDYGAKGKRLYRAGDAMLEAITVAHNGRNVGRGPMRVLAVFMGAEGIAPTKPEPR
jgi:quercetin dioxygenase-like cupin family protein